MVDKMGRGGRKIRWWIWSATK